MNTLKTALVLARRELRSGLQGFRIFLACIILGVASIAIIGSLSSALERGMNEQGQPLLGGDMEFSVIHRQLNNAELAHVASLGKLSRVATMRAIAIGKTARTLVEIKAIDTAYPLFGAVQLAGNGALQPRLEQTEKRWGAFAEPNLLARLGLQPGDEVSVGAARFVIHAAIVREADRISDGFVLGPRLMISHQGLKATGLLKPGALVRWRYRVRLNDQSADLSVIRAAAGKKFPDAGWRVRTRERAAPGAARFLSRVTMFLSLAGLTALVIGGTGVGNAVRTFLSRRAKNIATFKCLGAPSSLILAIYLIEVMAVASLGIAIGLLIGALVPLLTGSMLNDILPVPVAAGLDLMPLARAAGFGYLVTLAFSLWPLAQARRTPASHLFRGAIEGKKPWPEWPFMLAIGVCVAGIVILALGAFQDRHITLWYAVGLTASFAILILLAHLIMAVAKRYIRPKKAVAKLAIANLYRPGAPTTSIVLSLGLGVTLFVALALVDRNISGELSSAIVKNTPSFFFVDVQNSELGEFRKFVASQPGVNKTSAAPMLRGRIQKLNGKSLDKFDIAPHSAWAFHGDRGLTYAQDLPQGSKLTDGKWWPRDYDGPPLVSFVGSVARGSGLKIGDTVTVNILGRNITATIASFRDVDWQSLRINFAMVFSPNTLKGAPHTQLVTVTMDAEQEDALLRASASRYPGITAVRIRDAIEIVNQMLGKLLTAIRAASSVTMVTGILVLAGALASGLSARTYDAVILKTFGATVRQMISAFVFEYAILGLVTAVFSIFLGAIVSWAIIEFIMGMHWRFSVPTAVFTALATMALTIFAGLATTWRALSAKPARILRTQ